MGPSRQLTATGMSSNHFMISSMVVDNKLKRIYMRSITIRTGSILLIDAMNFSYNHFVPGIYRDYVLCHLQRSSLEQTVGWNLFLDVGINIMPSLIKIGNIQLTSYINI